MEKVDEIFSGSAGALYPTMAPVTTTATTKLEAAGKLNTGQTIVGNYVPLSVARSKKRTRPNLRLLRNQTPNPKPWEKRESLEPEFPNSAQCSAVIRLG